MSKELTGGAPVNQALEDGKKLINDNSSILSKSFSKHFNFTVKPTDLTMVDFYQSIIFAEPSTAKFYVNLISTSQIQFYRSIRSSKNTFNFEFPTPHKIFDDYFDKLSLILLTFYSDFEVIYMGQASFSRPLGSFMNKIFTPSLDIFQDNIKIMGISPRFQHLSKNAVQEERTHVVNLFEGREMECINKFIQNINKYAIPEGSDIVISIDDDIEDLKRNLSLVAMCLV